MSHSSLQNASKKIHKQPKPIYESVKLKQSEDPKKRLFAVSVPNSQGLIHFIDVMTFWSDRKCDPKVVKENRWNTEARKPQVKDFIVYKSMNLRHYEITISTVNQHTENQIARYFPKYQVVFRIDDVSKARNLDTLEKSRDQRHTFRPKLRGFTQDKILPQAMLAKELKALYSFFKLPGVFKYNCQLNQFEADDKENDEFNDDFEGESDEHGDDLEDKAMEVEDEAEPDDEPTQSDREFLYDNDASDNEGDRDYVPPRPKPRAIRATRRSRAVPQDSQAQAPQQFDMMAMMQQLLTQQQQQQQQFFLQIQQQIQEFKLTMGQNQVREDLQRLNIRDNDPPL